MLHSRVGDQGLNKLEVEHFCFAFVSVRDPDSFGRIKPEPKRDQEGTEEKTEIDVGTFEC